jgi:hypothetical protein
MRRGAVTIAPAAVNDIAYRRLMNALSSTLRVLARFLAVVATVLTVGVAMAWAWDRSDNPDRRQAAVAPVAVGEAR